MTFEECKTLWRRNWWNSLSDFWKRRFSINTFGADMVYDYDDENLKKMLKEKYVYCENIKRFSHDYSDRILEGNKEKKFPNDITSLEPLRDMKKVIKLSCGNNKITSLEHTKNMKNLRLLYCEDNQITSLEPLREKTGFRFLYFARNKITSLEPIMDLRHIEGISWEGNNISSEDKKEFIRLHPYCEIG